MFVTLTPQSIWWWTFEGTRPVLWIVATTMVGVIAALLQHKLDFTTLRNRRTVYILVLWLFYTLSYYFGAYIDVDGDYRFTEPEWAFTTVNKIMVLYLLACLCIDSQKKVKALMFVLVGSVVYMTYWANYQYLSGQSYGRLSGPSSLGGGGLYVDENNFAMLFVVALPFVWYAGLMFQNRFVRWGLWAVIPFGWHAVFLTGSRGGLVGIAVTLLLIVFRSRNKLFASLIIPAFIAAFLWQAGDLMRGRASTISEYKTEGSAAGRLNAWAAASNMMARHPVVGVGIASFGPAFPDHSDKDPREAHNTFFQIAAESGVVAGLMYLMTIISVYFGLSANGRKLRRFLAPNRDPTLFLINEAVLVGFVGLVTCSAFLSLQLFEIFYCLCVMANALLYITAKTGDDDAEEAAAETPGAALPSRR